jgi:hypothetical protein
MTIKRRILIQMKNTLAIAAVAILLAAGVYYSIRNEKHFVDDPKSGSLVKATPVVKSICVTPIQNLSHKPVAMEGIDNELVSQLQKVGFAARKVADGGQCDATTNAEVVDITGRARKTARVDFRLTLASEQVPRMSSSVEGKSGGKGGDRLENSMSEFAVNPESKETAGAAREAIVAALGKTAAQIDAANRKGLPPWQAKEQ